MVISHMFSKDSATMCNEYECYIKPLSCFLEQCLLHQSIHNYFGGTKEESFTNNTVFGACRAKEQCIQECGK